jgi:hypothetical protein
MASLTDIDCKDNQDNGGAPSINVEKKTSKNKARLITIVIIRLLLGKRSTSAALTFS